MIDWTAMPHQPYWYVFDAHQSVIGRVNNSGQLVVNYQYNAFGEITSATGTTTTGDGKLLRDANPFRYASYQYDTESGFYYLKSRYYNASIQRNFSDCRKNSLHRRRFIKAVSALIYSIHGEILDKGCSSEQ